MRQKLNTGIREGVLLLLMFLLMLNVSAQTWPTAEELAEEMIVGWNLGNSLEVPDGETAWGNPATTQELIDAVSGAGFNTIRIPCAWDSYADETTHEIDTSWLARVKEVVDYCINNDMYIIINGHWDGGWLEENPLYSAQDEVNEKQEAYWTQIANYFIGYDEHLLFAGTNEVHADYNTPTTEHIEVQESYNQTFVSAVRATGGNNTSRILIVQTYNTNMWYGLEYFTLPTDTVSDRLIVETHYYDPYNYTLNQDTSGACIVWGQPWSSGDVCSWGQEDYVEDLFARMKSQYVDEGVPLIIGEYGVVKRTSLTGSDYTDHIASRLYYLEYITDAAKRYGMLPIYWDNGHNGDNGLALFDRSSGSIVDQDALNAILDGAGIIDSDVTYSITTSVSSGSGTINLTPSGGTYEEGSIVTLTAEAETGWRFDSWSGDLSGSDNPTTLTMSEDYAVSATFIVSEGEEYCDDPNAVSMPFSQDGSGEYCWVTSDDIGNVNSWNLDALEINGEDYTNAYSSSMPDKVDGNYYIYYKGSYDWSHVEFTSLKSATSSVGSINHSEEIKVSPNPFRETFNLSLESPESIQSIVIVDQLGRQVKKIENFSDSQNIEIGQSLKEGVYILQVRGENGVRTFTITKRL